MAFNERINRNIEQLNKAFLSLEKAIRILNYTVVKDSDDLKKSVQDSIIQRFEYTYELLWKVFKRLAEKDAVEVVSPREAFKFAFKKKFIAEENEAVFNEILKKRNLTVHTYCEQTANDVLTFIMNQAIEAIRATLLKINENIEKKD